jgi:hypothetical protein
MFDAPLKQVQTMRFKSLATGCPSEERSSLGTIFQPRWTPVNPAYFKNDALNSNMHIYKTTMEKVQFYTRAKLNDVTNYHSSGSVIVRITMQLRHFEHSNKQYKQVNIGTYCLPPLLQEFQR